MKKLVFAAIAMMVMVSASNSFATKSATSMNLVIYLQDHGNITLML